MVEKKLSKIFFFHPSPSGEGVERSETDEVIKKCFAQKFISRHFFLILVELINPTMSYTPRFIILKQVMRYLPHEKQKQLWADLGTYAKLPQGKYFCKVIEKYFDWELFRSKPLIWQDIWLYNYIKYEQKMVKSHLLRKYEMEAFCDDDEYFFKYKDEINSQTLTASFLPRKKVKVLPPDEQLKKLIAQHKSNNVSEPKARQT